MLTLDFHPTGRHFLQIPGPSPVPDRILRAMSLPTIDHRGPEFGALGLKVLAGIRKIFKTRHPVVIYPASGTGAWEAALVEHLSPGDQVLMYETGHFAVAVGRAGRRGWACRPSSSHGRQRRASAARAGLAPRRAGRPDRAAPAQGDTQHRIKAVCVVHNETSTGVTSNIAAGAQGDRCGASIRRC